MANSTALEPMLKKLNYWHPLQPSDQEALLALPHRVRAVAANQFLVREREQATHCCVMLSGFSIRQKVVGAGARQILSIHMRGDVVDLQNSVLGTADHSVQMLTRGEIAAIPLEQVQKIAAEHPRIAMAMWRDTLVDGSIFREWIANVGRRDAATRIAHVLCEFAMRLQISGIGDRSNYQLPMTQAELADVVGLTPIHVNRTLKGLEARKLIVRNRRAVTIVDWQRLADAGDFDPAYLHLQDGQAATQSGVRQLG